MSDDDGTRERDDASEVRSGREEPLADLAAEVRERGDSERDRPGREGPLADVASEVDRRRDRRDDDTFDAFESVEVGEVDGERLWEELAEGGDASVGAAVAPEATDEAERAPGASDRDVRTVPKETCHGCPHLADPPELACTHEGTDILAMPDSDHFRVADCPMVGDEEVRGLGVESTTEDSDPADSSEVAADSDPTDSSDSTGRET